MFICEMITVISFEPCLWLLNLLYIYAFWCCEVDVMGKLILLLKSCYSWFYWCWCDNNDNDVDIKLMMFMRLVMFMMLMRLRREKNDDQILHKCIYYSLTLYYVLYTLLLILEKIDLLIVLIGYSSSSWIRCTP